MKDNDLERSTKLFEERLAIAQNKVSEDFQKKKLKNLIPGNILSLAFRIGVELVSAIAIGLAIGWLLDNWLYTKPWFMIVFILLGGAAGILNVFRLANGFGYVVGYKKDKETQKDKPGDENP